MRQLKDNSKAEKLLPCIEGFFFGEINLDEYYFSELKRTSKEIAKIISFEKLLANNKTVSSYVYTSS